jgi:AhpD family alkylhydroperoxidase
LRRASSTCSRPCTPGACRSRHWS